MSDFEFLFALYGLLLGLSLAEILGGLARAIEARIRPGVTIRVGWLTPLLAIFVLLDLLSFWSSAWTSRAYLSVSSHALFGVMSFAGAYYLAAALVFPRQADEQPDFDDHFFRVRRIVLGILLALLACQIVWNVMLPPLSARFFQPLNLSMTALLALLMIAAMWVRGTRWVRLIMLALVARYLVLILRQIMLSAA